MHANTLEYLPEPIAPGVEIDPLSLYSALEHVHDGRKPRGKRYQLALVLSLLLMGKLAGMRSLAAIAEWVRWRADWLGQVLPSTRATFPCVATYSNVLQAVEAEQVVQVVVHFFTRLEAQRRCDEEPSRLVGQPEHEYHRQVALDGKPCGAR